MNKKISLYLLSIISIILSSQYIMSSDSEGHSEFSDFPGIVSYVIPEYLKNNNVLPGNIVTNNVLPANNNPALDNKVNNNASKRIVYIESKTTNPTGGVEVHNLYPHLKK